MRRTTILALVTVTVCASWLAADVLRAEEIDDSRLVELGRRLFHEPAASARGDTACGDCHDPRHAYSDPRRLSIEAGRTTRRHSQPLLDLGPHAMHWDGEFDTLRHLLAERVAAPGDRDELVSARLSANYRGPFAPFVPRRAGPEDGEPITAWPARPRQLGGDAWLRADGRYARGFELAYGDDAVTIERVVDALQAFVTSLRSRESPYDRFIDGNQDALTERARRGLALFTGRALCSTCHPLGEGRAITDHEFHDTGVSRSRRWWIRDPFDWGRGDVTEDPADRQKFKTPNLRDVSRRRPFMHNGAFDSLAEVVEHYATGGDSRDEIEPIDLTEQERADLVAFLRALTGTSLHAAPETPVSSRRTARVRVVDLQGRPLPGLSVSSLPAGDPLRANALSAVQIGTVTDERGRATIAIPATSHFKVVSADHELGTTRRHPDWWDDMTLIATRKSVVSVWADCSDFEHAPDRLFVRVLVRGETRDLELREVRWANKRWSLYASNRCVESPYQVQALFADFAHRRVQLALPSLDLTGGASPWITLRAPPNAR